LIQFYSRRRWQGSNTGNRDDGDEERLLWRGLRCVWRYRLVRRRSVRRYRYR